MNLTDIQFNAITLCAKKSKTLILGFILATVLAAALSVSGPLIFSHAISAQATSEFDTTILIIYFVAFGLTIGGGRLIQDIKVVIMSRLEQEIKAETGKSIMTSLINSRGAIFVENNSSAISEMTQNLHQSNTIYIQVMLMVFISGVAEIIFSFSVIGKKISWLIALFSTLYGIATIWITLRGNAATTQHQKKARSKSIKGANLLGGAIDNITTIRILGAGKWISNLYDFQNQEIKKHWNDFYLSRLKYGAVQATLITFQYSCIFTITILSLQEKSGVSNMVLVGMILIQLNRPFEMIGGSLREFAIARGLAEPLQSQLTKHKDEIYSGKSIRPSIDSAPTISLNQITISHLESERPILTNLSATFKPGNINFITGPSGSGKTSIIQSLLKLKEINSGKIFINNEDLSEISTSNYLPYIGYVAQEPMLINLSIRDNILFGRNFSDHQILDVLKRVKLDSKLNSLKEGLDYTIGERGQLLSGGERQRLAIARALIGDPHILFLDEPSSALDENTERGIFDTLRTNEKKMTIIAVTHRHTVISLSDNVIDLPSNAELI
ncbi:MAG: ABC transporter ATP-binding protein [Burkholderia cenocepacia]